MTELAVVSSQQHFFSDSRMEETSQRGKPVKSAATSVSLVNLEISPQFARSISKFPAV